MFFNKTRPRKNVLSFFWRRGQRTRFTNTDTTLNRYISMNCWHCSWSEPKSSWGLARNKSTYYVVYHIPITVLVLFVQSFPHFAIPIVQNLFSISFTLGRLLVYQLTARQLAVISDICKESQLIVLFRVSVGPHS